MIFKRHAVMLLATGGYVGYIPIASGTFGSLVGIPLVFIFSMMPTAWAALAVLALILIAVWAAREVERQMKAKDPGCIVIDEIAGMCVTMLTIPFNPATCAAGFILFRIFDVIKPPPAKWMERRLKGGWGVVMDDVAAGIMAHLLLRFGLYLIK